MSLIANLFKRALHLLSQMGHVLGVTSDSLAYFHHPLTGHPLTRRPSVALQPTALIDTATPLPVSAGMIAAEMICGFDVSAGGLDDCGWDDCGFCFISLLQGLNPNPILCRIIFGSSTVQFTKNHKCYCTIDS